MKIHAYNPEYHIDLSGAAGVISRNYSRTSLGSNTPLADSGGGSPGSGPQAAPWDHVHPASGGASSFGSNSTRVSSVSAAGASSSNSRADHVHDGIGTVTASGSNTLNRGTLNLRAGTGIALALSNTDGGSGFDTATITNIASSSGGPGGSGWPPTFPTAPTLVESVAWVQNSGSATPGLTLASTPNTGDVLVVAVFSNQYEAKAPSGAGATWTCIVSDGWYGGSVLPASLWMGVVGGSPTTSITVNMHAGNSAACSVLNFRGLTGVVERTVFRGMNNQDADTYFLTPMLPILSPVCVALTCTRSTTTNPSAIGGGFTADRTTTTGSNPGTAVLAHLDTTQLTPVHVSWTLPLSASILTAALIY